MSFLLTGGASLCPPGIAGCPGYPRCRGTAASFYSEPGTQTVTTGKIHRKINPIAAI